MWELTHTSQGSAHTMAMTMIAYRSRKPQGPLRGFTRISTRASCQDPEENPTRPSEKDCCCWKGSYKILRQEPPKSIPEELSYKQSTSNTWHLQALHARTSQPGSDQDLHKIFWQGPVQHHASWQGPLRKDFTRTFTKPSWTCGSSWKDHLLDDDLHKIF